MDVMEFFLERAKRSSQRTSLLLVTEYTLLKVLLLLFTFILGTLKMY